ncbi:MAG: peptidoglycan DD-metalloendopeptidase family protein [Candidatus Nanopelagicales bacterium]|nr:peptidoglycan DD-metalloendopeptidase family protein [Candidatus Nanopelagicales bacterium]MDP4666909.1 peptidoglycan DD-metalloendopeptidase family protein [Candidatus Nanopelagicales bacterium]
MITPAIANTTDIDKKVAEASDALNQASKAVQAAAASLKEVQAKLPAARQVLAAANALETQSIATYKSATADLAAAKAAFTESLAKVTSKEAEISQLQIKVDQFARSVYQQGPTSQWEIILESESPSDLTVRLQNIKAVSSSTALSLDELVIAKEQLAIDAAAAESVRQEMQRISDIAAQALIDAQAAADRAAIAKAEVDRLVNQEAAALRVAEDDKRRVQAEYNELRAEQKRIAALAKRAGSQGPVDPQATGPLSWPLPGRAAGGGVGWRVHPVYKYRSCHTGVDSGAPGGTPILAAASGVVLSTSVSRAYGNLTLLDHGGGVVTMYAHQSRFAVSVGQAVGNQQVIGYVGTTGFSTGNHLHFEVHLNGVPYNPMGWFGANKTVVPCWG